MKAFAKNMNKINDILLFLPLSFVHPFCVIYCQI